MAGKIGILFAIANMSRTTCSIEEYPKLTLLPDRHKKSSVRVIAGGRMIIRAVNPKLIVLTPSADASFGLDYGDAANQQDPDGAACTTRNIYVALPVRASQSSVNYETTVNFNVCFTNFEVIVTSLEPGPLPKKGRASRGARGSPGTDEVGLQKRSVRYADVLKSPLD